MQILGWVQILCSGENFGSGHFLGFLVNIFGGRGSGEKCWLEQKFWVQAKI